SRRNSTNNQFQVWPHRCFTCFQTVQADLRGDPIGVPKHDFRWLDRCSLVNITSSDREFLVVSELILVAHLLEVRRATALDNLPPDESNNPTGEDNARHDVDQC